MTYEEYKSKKSGSKNTGKNFFKKLFSKLFTIIIFVMIVVISSNYSPKFRTFVTDKVLNNTMDFSKVNNIVDKVTSIFKTDEVKPVASLPQNNKTEKYKDGIKYIINDNEEIYVKDSGIVTFIGQKDGYNNTIIIQQSNGYYAWYGNVKESIKLYDYVEAGSIIGSASDEYYYVLLKDDKPIDITNEN